MSRDLTMNICNTRPLPEHSQKVWTTSNRGFFRVNRVSNLSRGTSKMAPLCHVTKTKPLGKTGQQCECLPEISRLHDLWFRRRCGNKKRPKNTKTSISHVIQVVRLRASYMQCITICTKNVQNFDTIGDRLLAKVVVIKTQCIVYGDFESFNNNRFFEKNSKNLKKKK